MSPDDSILVIWLFLRNGELIGPGQELSMKITKGNNSKIMWRVMVLGHCTSPQWNLLTYEVSSLYLQYLSSHVPDKNYEKLQRAVTKKLWEREL